MKWFWGRKDLTKEELQKQFKHDWIILLMLSGFFDVLTLVGIFFPELYLNFLALDIFCGVMSVLWAMLVMDTKRTYIEKYGREN